MRLLVAETQPLKVGNNAPCVPGSEQGRHSSAEEAGCLLFPGAAPPAPFLFLLLSWQASFSAFQSFLVVLLRGGHR